MVQRDRSSGCISPTTAAMGTVAARHGLAVPAIHATRVP
jgi:hypothetical protein